MRTYFPSAATESNPFIGTDGLVNGEQGAVPAPETTDVGKFLNSNGKWVALTKENYVLDPESGQMKLGAKLYLDGMYIPLAFAPEEEFDVDTTSGQLQVNIEGPEQPFIVDETTGDLMYAKDDYFDPDVT